MSRHLATVFALAVSLGLPITAHAQETALERQGGEPPRTIDILAPPFTDEPELDPDCVALQQTAILFGEIVVCAERKGDENRLYDKETAERRHAERTAYKGDPEAPDFILDCHEQGWPVGCVRLGSVPPPAYMIDFEELPDTPAGSDADRMARGLAPRGYDRKVDGAAVIADEPALQANAEELGLPPPLAEETEEVSPSGSASPAEPQ